MLCVLREYACAKGKLLNLITLVQVLDTLTEAVHATHKRVQPGGTWCVYSQRILRAHPRTSTPMPFICSHAAVPLVQYRKRQSSENQLTASALNERAFLTLSVLHAGGKHDKGMCCPHCFGCGTRFDYVLGLV